ncbi:Argonaute 2 [Actinosynnema pretiosum subsp. pretiosum]|nr:Argonaute 2 [Actinosynnema pretiosum subsp. pretiosum]
MPHAGHLPAQTRRAIPKPSLSAEPRPSPLANGPLTLG